MTFNSTHAPAESTDGARWASLGRERLRLLAVQTTGLPTAETGVFRTLLESVTTLRQGGYAAADVDVLLLQGVDLRAERTNAVAEAFRRIPGVTVRAINMGKLGRHDTVPLDRALKVRDLAAMRFTRRQVRAAARHFQPDVIYSAQQRWDLRLVTPVAQALGIPQIVHLHHTVGPWLGRDAVDALREAGLVAAVSDYIRDDAIRHGVQAGRARTLHNGVVLPPEPSREERATAKADLRTELALPADALLVGMCARLNRQKGQEELVEAMLPILARDPRVGLVLAGSEDPLNNGTSERIAGAARARGVQERVRLLGHRQDVLRILDGLDLFAHPSHADAFGLSILEAMAYGLPVVAWREGGPAELIVDGETGLLVPPGEIAELTSALEALLAGAGLRAALGARGRERAATAFNPSHAAASFLSLLREARGAIAPADDALQ